VAAGETVVVFTIHATRKLLDRVKQPVEDPVSPPTSLFGNWYATVLFWKPQIALFVNEATLLPVLVALAPAATLGRRFPDQLRVVLDAHGIAPNVIDHEITAMGQARYAKTANRSVVGIMNEFAYLGDLHRHDPRVADLEAVALEISRTPCGPLDKRHGSPDRELHALLNGPTPG